MLRRHAIGDDTVVALTAFANDVGVINEIDRRPKRATVMTRFAARGGGNMVFAATG